MYLSARQWIHVFSKVLNCSSNNEIRSNQCCIVHSLIECIWCSLTDYILIVELSLRLLCYQKVWKFVTYFFFFVVLGGVFPSVRVAQAQAEDQKADSKAGGLSKVKINKAKTGLQALEMKKMAGRKTGTCSRLQKQVAQTPRKHMGTETGI